MPLDRRDNRRGGGDRRNNHGRTRPGGRDRDGYPDNQIDDNYEDDFDGDDFEDTVTSVRFQQDGIISRPHRGPGTATAK